MRWTFASLTAHDALGQRSSFVAFLQRWGVTGGDFNAAEVVFGELVGNVVRHAPGPIAIDVDWSGNVPRLRVSDRGPGFAFAGCSISDAEEEDGRGMFLVGAFTDDLRIEPRPGGGTSVTVLLLLQKAAGSAEEAEARESEHSQRYGSPAR
jgi:serine/threonine-protein kinase RsbW